MHPLAAAYQSGTIDARAVAITLGVRVVEALGWLEAEGAARSVDQIRLTPEERDRALAVLAADYKRRGGVVRVSEEEIRRGAEASSSLSGIPSRLMRLCPRRA